MLFADILHFFYVYCEKYLSKKLSNTDIICTFVAIMRTIKYKTNKKTHTYETI